MNKFIIMVIIRTFPLSEIDQKIFDRTGRKTNAGLLKWRNTHVELTVRS